MLETDRMQFAREERKAIVNVRFHPAHTAPSCKQLNPAFHCANQKRATLIPARGVRCPKILFRDE